MATISTNLSTNRIAINQVLDYRIFVVSAYHKDELAGGMEPNIVSAMESQKILGSSPTNGKNYWFFKYAIDNFVESVDIHRSVDGSPAHLSLTLFPIKENPQTDEDFNFYYKWNQQYLPVFRRMDYIEIQVAETTITDKSSADDLNRYNSFQKLLANPKTSTDYQSPSISDNYRVRFRGFVTDVIDEDTAESGRRIRLEAASMLYYLSMSPFVTELAMFNQYLGTQNQAYIPNNQYINITGDQLTDLRSAIKRVIGFFEQIFFITSKNESISNPDPSRPETVLPYAVGDTSDLGKTESAKLSEALSSDDLAEVAKTSTVQTNIIPLAEYYFAKNQNFLGDSNFIFRILNLSDLYDKEIELVGRNPLFVSQYSYLLEVLNQWKKGLCYALFEESDGCIAYERPFLNVSPDLIIDNKIYIEYSYRESATGYITDVFTSPANPIKTLPDSLRDVCQQPSGYNLDELRRYGYRRPDVMINPNVSSNLGLSLFSKTVKVVNNASLRSLTFSIPYNTKLDIGDTVWFQEKQILGFVTDIHENIKFGASGIMDVTLSYLRNVTEINKKLDKITVDNFAESVKVSDFPEYIFAGNFYTEGVVPIDTSKTIINIKERAAYPSAVDIRPVNAQE